MSRVGNRKLEIGEGAAIYRVRTSRDHGGDTGSVLGGRVSRLGGFDYKNAVTRCGRRDDVGCRGLNPHPSQKPAKDAAPKGHLVSRM
jgi:hypothetical protein